MNAFENEQLRRRGWEMGYYVGTHSTARDPEHCFYIAPKVMGGYEAGDKPADLLRFATFAEISRFLDETQAGIKPDTCGQPLWMEAQNAGLFFGPHKHRTTFPDGRPSEQRFYVSRKTTGRDDKLTPQDVLVKYATEAECRKVIEDYRNAR
jgi:hypothetical protein